ncbi:GAF domain-containing sensor histidine kinase [Ilyomonas limi]|nr:GAF domain-containing sensor histidine kinase [Ilyomonas limi]
MSLQTLDISEHERLRELYHTEILDTPSESDFDDIVRLTAQTFNMPVALITFVDSDRVWVKASVDTPICEAKRNEAVCHYTIAQEEVLEVPDLREDTRFRHLSQLQAVSAYRYYAGAPLATSRGYKIGSLCVLDKKPRHLTHDQKAALQVLARHVISLIELRVRNREMAQLSEMQNKIISIIGHDIRNPLASFRVMLDLLDDKSKDFDEEEAAEMNDLLRKQMDSTLDLLNNLVQWGKLHVRLNKSAPDSVDMHKLVNRVMRPLEFSVTLKGNKFINDIPEETYLLADEQALEFVLRNLLTNANKFTDKGNITVAHQFADNQHLLSVRDTGTGMDEQQIKQVLYENGNYYTIGTNAEKGSGLGLSLVREFLSKINSSLAIQSTVGEGTTVSFNIYN